MSNDLIEADQGGHGFVRGDPKKTRMHLTRAPGWMASLDEGDAGQMKLSASAKYRNVSLYFSAEDCWDLDQKAWGSTEMTPQAALRLVEQLLTAVKYAINEERWSPEYEQVEFDYGLDVLEGMELEQRGDDAE